MSFNRHALRRLYNLGNRGKGVEGKKTRADLHVTISYPTYITLGRVIPVQRGGYGSPVVELGIRIILYLVGRLSLETLGEELVHALLPGRSAVATRLMALATFVSRFDSDDVTEALVDETPA